MSEIRKTAALVSLTALYTDSENEDDDGDGQDGEDGKRRDQEPIQREEFVSPDKFKLRLPVLGLEATGASRSNSPFTGNAVESLARRVSDEERQEQLDQNECVEGLIQYDDDDRPSSPIHFHRSLQNLPPHAKLIPPDPPGRCSKSLVEKITKLYEKSKEGRDMNASIQKRKDFRNPSIYEKLIAYCGIDELGSNYPPEIYNPNTWTSQSYYDELSKKQKEEMDRKERERRERTKVEFVTGTKKGGDNTSSGDRRKKTKWDVGGAVGNLIPQTAIPLNIPTGTKPTVISAFGSIKKPK